MGNAPIEQYNALRAANATCSEASKALLTIVAHERAARQGVSAAFDPIEAKAQEVYDAACAARDLIREGIRKSEQEE